MSEFIELSNRYGSAVVGEGQASTEALQATVTGGGVYGGSVMGDAVSHDKKLGVYLSLDDLFDHLLKSPTSWNSLLGEELSRADGPRLEALRIFLEIAEQQETASEALENLRTVIRTHPDAPIAAPTPAPEGDAATPPPEA